MAHSKAGGILLMSLIALTAFSYCSRPDVGPPSTLDAGTTSWTPNAASSGTAKDDVSEEADTRYVRSIALNLRSAPRGPVVGTIVRGTAVQVYETEGKWARISQPPDAPQWVSEPNLCSEPACAGGAVKSPQMLLSEGAYPRAAGAVAEKPSARFVRSVELNVRSAPAGPVVGTLTRFSRVEVYQTQGKWARISSLTEAPLWVSEPNLCSYESCSEVGGSQSVMRSEWAEPVSKPNGANDLGCPCSGSQNCIGPRGGRYCITSGGNKRYRR